MWLNYQSVARGARGGIAAVAAVGSLLAGAATLFGTAHARGTTLSHRQLAALMMALAGTALCVATVAFFRRPRRFAGAFAAGGAASLGLLLIAQFVWCGAIPIVQNFSVLHRIGTGVRSLSPSTRPAPEPLDLEPEPPRK